jgi:hypothetical protein
MVCTLISVSAFAAAGQSDIELSEYLNASHTRNKGCSWDQETMDQYTDLLYKTLVKTRDLSSKPDGEKEKQLIVTDYKLKESQIMKACKIKSAKLLSKEKATESFCKPNEQETYCETRDGRIYKLEKSTSVNEINRTIEKDKTPEGTDVKKDEAKKATAAK